MSGMPRSRPQEGCPSGKPGQMAVVAGWDMVSAQQATFLGQSSKLGSRKLGYSANLGQPGGAAPCSNSVQASGLAEWSVLMRSLNSELYTSDQLAAKWSETNEKVRGGGSAPAERAAEAERRERHTTSEAVRPGPRRGCAVVRRVPLYPLIRIYIQINYKPRRLNCAVNCLHRGLHPFHLTGLEPPSRTINSLRHTAKQPQSWKRRVVSTGGRFSAPGPSSSRRASQSSSSRGSIERNRRDWQLAMARTTTRTFAHLRNVRSPARCVNPHVARLPTSSPRSKRIRMRTLACRPLQSPFAASLRRRPPQRWGRRLDGG